MEHGAQPSDRVARLLKSEGVKLPKWVKLESTKARDIRNPEKLRKNRPAEEAAPSEKSVEEAPVEQADNAAEETTETPEAQPEAEPSETAEDTTSDEG